jgi:hypothetical protein
MFERAKKFNVIDREETVIDPLWLYYIKIMQHSLRGAREENAGQGLQFCSWLCLPRSLAYLKTQLLIFDDLNSFVIQNEDLYVYIFWDIVPCSTYIGRRFGGTCHLQLHGKKSDEQETRVQVVAR